MHLLLALVAAVQQPIPPPNSTPTPPAAADTAHVVIVATTDVHGRVLGWDYVRDAAAPGGLSRAATILESLRAQYPDRVVLVDAGDLVEGNLFARYFAESDSQHPNPAVDALNAMQYDAATPGSHDFDFGRDVLARATGDATYRYVSANIFKGATDTLLYPPHIIVVRGGVRVGITGFTTPGVMVWDRSQLGGAVRVRRIGETDVTALRGLEQAGVDLKVVLIHSGLNEPSSYDTTGIGAENVALTFAGLSPRPDIVIVGHTHKELRDYVVNDVHFVQPRNNALSLAVVHVWLVKDTGGYRIIAVRSDLVPLASVPEHPRFVRRFQAAHERARAWVATSVHTAGQGFEAPVPPAAPRPDSTMLRVLAINDFHGALEPQGWPWSGGRQVGGAAALKPWLDSLARACFCTSVRLDGGDEMQGTPVSNFNYGRPAIAALNALGIDAAAIGNHEFDWSVDTLRARMAEARYRFLAANVTDSTGLARPDWAVPYTVIERNGMRIAVIGLALPSTPEQTTPKNVRGLAFRDPVAAVKRVLPQARAAADYVIVVAHIGAFCSADTAAVAAPLGPAACRGEIIDLARGLDSGSVDLIVSGHTHSLVNTVVNGIPIVQARSSGAGIAVVDFVRVGSGREVRARIETPFTDRVSPDPALSDAFRLDRLAIDAVISRAVARVGSEMRRSGDEYGLGRLIADAQRAIAKTDVSLLNNGGIRADLGAGVATYGDLFRVEPFQNRLLRVVVSGKVLRAALEHALRGDRPDAHIAGIEVWYDPRKPAGRRIKKLRLADGRGVDGDGRYTLAVSDFLGSGGGGYTMLHGLPSGDVGMTDLDALIQYLSVLHQPIAPPDDPRWHREGDRR
jgi:2',3'-cyclic-nucleotide 2'-phosphodiesterase (5'-nucleotidase family)